MRSARVLSKWCIVAAAAVLGAAALAPASRADGGGSSIVAAPQLPINTTVVGGASASASGYEFWRVTLAAGDRLTIAYQPVNGNQVSLVFFQPSVTDFTLGSANSITSDRTSAEGTSGKKQFSWIATGAGQWILRIDAYSHGYQLTAGVKHKTVTTFIAPALVRNGANVTYHGKVQGAASGNVVLQAKASTGSAWPTIAQVPIGADGSFSHTAKVVATGTYRIRAVYPGDSSHLPSQALASLKIVDTTGGASGSASSGGISLNVVPSVGLLGQAVVFYGTVAGATGGSVVIETRSGSGWSTEATASVKSDGSFFVVIKPTQRRAYTERARLSGRPESVSGTTTYQVK